MAFVSLSWCRITSILPERCQNTETEEGYQNKTIFQFVDDFCCVHRCWLFCASNFYFNLDVVLVFSQNKEIIHKFQRSWRSETDENDNSMFALT